MYIYELEEALYKILYKRKSCHEFAHDININVATLF